MEYYKNLDLKDIVYFCEIDNIEKTEQWKDVVGFEELYQVSDLGRVKSYDKRYLGVDKIGRNLDRFYPKRIMKQSLEKSGYLRLTLTDRNKIETRHAVHRLCAIAFIPNPDNLPEVNHKRGNKQDNRLFILEWSTSADNIKHAWKTGLCKKQLGEKHSQSVLIDKDVLFIRSSELSRKELSKMFGVGVKCIDKIINRQRWKHI